MRRTESRIGVLALCAFALVLPFATRAALQVKVTDSSKPHIPSDVAWTEETIEQAKSGDALRGLLISRRCERCHGDEGFSPSPAIPNLAGMNPLVTWKQLEDFRVGRRESMVMTNIASALSLRDSADLAAYYSLLPSSPDPQDNRAFPDKPADVSANTVAARLVSLGDGRRGIPPCAGCHGPVAYVTGAPSLATQNGEYILRELDSFTDGTRENDINVRMRSIARALSEDERHALADYYGAGRGTGPAAAAFSR